MANLPLDYASPDLRRDGWLTRQLTSPLGWPTQVATAVMFVACLGASANYMRPFMVAFVGVPMLVIWWLFRLLNWSLNRSTESQGNARRVRRRWLVLPVLASLATVLIGFDLPAQTLFAIHRTKLEAIAKSAADSPTPVTWTRPAGLYGRVTITQVEPGIIGVSVPGMGITGIDGFVYIATDVPPASPPRDGWIQRRIAPRWFKWVRASF
jgi:hypothetical protein